MFEKKCSVCGSTKLEKGYMLFHGSYWESAEKATGFRGLFTKPTLKNTTAYKCSNCGKIEIYFE